LPADELSYGEALAELEALLGELEDDRVDIDVLGDKVRRAAELIARCRARIADARMEVDRIVGTLDDTAVEAGTGAEDEADG
jgi:exodeoxyribonuclease VII small subunit